PAISLAGGALDRTRAPADLPLPPARPDLAQRGRSERDLRGDRVGRAGRGLADRLHGGPARRRLPGPVSRGPDRRSACPAAAGREGAALPPGSRRPLPPIAAKAVAAERAARVEELAGGARPGDRPGDGPPSATEGGGIYPLIASKSAPPSVGKM